MFRCAAAVPLIVLLATCAGFGQQPSANTREQEIHDLRTELSRISARLDALEHPEHAGERLNAAVSAAKAEPAPSPAAGPQLSEDDVATLGFFRSTTLNFVVDGYYDYNFNAPVGRVNLLRAYDVTSNSFSINQADIVVERLPKAEPGQRYGGRIDLMFGQATETLQGSPANEQRPQVWRNLFQAYGSYLAPVGSGLRVDFGKWASALGTEGNYTKDQWNYSRAYTFNFLPFYHMGFRASYDVTPEVNLAYWVVNGAQQTEDFNGFKSQALLATLKPAKTVQWNVNYYEGQEQRDVEPTLNPGAPTGPTQPGLPTTPISPAPNGREHIADTYAMWNVTPKFSLMGEADFVINRYYSDSAPQHVWIGAAYARYTLPHDYAIAGRAEYFDDRNGLFSGQSQALKETTLTFDKLLQPGLLTRLEWRRDFSNQRFFLSDTPGALEHGQTTATLGLVYWWGMKQGSW